MGNAQKKFPGREEEPTAWKKRDDGDSGPRKDMPGRGNKGGSPKEADNARNACQRRPEQSPAAPGAGAAPPAVNGPTSLLPPTAATLKDQGNELFKHGQFGAAVAKYSEAIDSLRNPGTAIPEELSILYSNRAACYLKDGNCGDCIEDCTRALELQPFSIKPLLRRALAYESVEKYRQAYVDYKTVLQIDSGIQSANDSINRITRTLMDQDGLNWREKLPPIPAVPVSAQSHRWAGSCTPSKATKAQVTSSKTSEEMFLSLKQEGNALVKKAQFRQALEKYNACVKLNSNECSIYTNRALCYLKLDQFDEARQDCDRALQLDDANVKAFYRRAIAHKGLKNYQASINDLNKVLQMDQNVSEARKELEEVTQSLKARKNSIANSQEKQRKKIDIQEINGKKEEGRKSKDLISSVATERVENRPVETNKKMTIFKPTNAYDFGQLMNAVRAEKDSAACAELLTTVEPKDLPSFLSNKLEVDTFLIIIQSLKSYLLEEQPTLVYQHLLYLSKADRFEINLTLLSKSEKNQVRELFDALFEKQHQKLIFEDVPSLSRNYYL